MYHRSPTMARIIRGCQFVPGTAARDEGDEHVYDLEPALESYCVHEYGIFPPSV